MIAKRQQNRFFAEQVLRNQIIWRLFLVTLWLTSAISLETNLITAIENELEHPNGTILLNYGNGDMVSPTLLQPIEPINGNETHYITSDANATESKTKVEELSKVFKSTIFQIRQKYKKIDIVFLIDSSSSVGKQNFLSEMKFVVKFLSDFNVSFNYTRVAIVTFSSQGKIVSAFFCFK